MLGTRLPSNRSSKAQSRIRYDKSFIGESKKNVAPFYSIYANVQSRTHSGKSVRRFEKQTLQDFEWVLVDDGSSDDTRSLVESWLHGPSFFRIRYLSQSHCGKHFAINRAVQEANGFFFIILDSDDTCVSEALERFAYHWQTIPEGERSLFCGVTSLCQEQDGHLVGVPLPGDTMVSNHLEMIYKFKIKDEMWLCIRTDVMREYPFPEIEVRYFPEAIVWTKIARRYKTLYVNEMLRVYWQDQPSLMRWLSCRQCCWRPVRALVSIDGAN